MCIAGAAIARADTEEHLYSPSVRPGENVGCIKLYMVTKKRILFVLHKIQTGNLHENIQFYPSPMHTPGAQFTKRILRLSVSLS